MDLMSNSAGALSDSYATYAESTEAHIQSMKDALAQLGSDVFNSDFLKFWIDFAKGALNVLDAIAKVTKKIGGLKTILISVGAIIGAIKLNSITKGLTSLWNGISKIGKGFTSFGKVIATLVTPTTKLGPTFNLAAQGTGKFGTALKMAGVSASTAQIAFAGVGIAIAALVAIYSNLKQAHEEALQAAKENADSFDQTKSSIEDYANEIESLRTKLSDGNLSEDEAYSARERLLEIQNSLYDSYGREADGLDLVNGKLEEQIALLGDLTKSKAGEFLNENRKEIAEAEKEMEATRKKVLNPEAFISDTSDIYKEISDIVDKYEHIIKEENPNAPGNYQISFVGNVREAEKDINGFMSDIRDMEDELGKNNLFTSILDTSGLELGHIKELEETYGSLYDSAKNAEMVTDSLLYGSGNQKKHASEWLNDYTNAVNEYNTALSSGKFEDIDSAKTHYEELHEQIHGMLDDSSGFDKYTDNVEAIESKISSAAEGAAQATVEAREVVEQNKISFSDLFTDEEGKASEFKDNVDKYVSDVEKLQGALDKLKSDEFDIEGKDFFDLIEAFPDLSGHASDLESAIESLMQTMTGHGSVSESDFSNIKHIYEKYQQDLKEVSDLGFTPEQTLLGDEAENVGKVMHHMGDSGDLALNYKELTDALDNAGISLEDFENALKDTDATSIEATGIIDAFEQQFGKLKTKEDVNKLREFMKVTLELGKVVGDTKFSIDIEAEINGMNDLFSAMKESVTSTGLSAKSVENLTNRYKELSNFDAAALFEKTANGIHLNTSELRKLENEYEKQTKSENAKALQEMSNRYNQLSEAISKTGRGAELLNLYQERSSLRKQIEEAAALAAEYDGLTSAFYKWEQAQSIGEEGDMYDNLAGGLENIQKLYEEGLVGTNKFRTAVQLMTDRDVSTATVEELMQAYDEGYPKMQRYFTEGAEGCQNFLADVSELNSEWAHMNEDGSWEIDFGLGNDQEIAEALGINVESVQAAMRKLSDYGFDINLDSIYSPFDLLSSKAEKANERLNELTGREYRFDFDTTDIVSVETDLIEARSLLDSIRNDDGTINLEAEGAEEILTIFYSLMSNKQALEAPAIMSIDAQGLMETDAELGEVVGLLQEFVYLANTYEIQIETGDDTVETEKRIQEISEQLLSLPDEVSTIVNLNSENAELALGSIQTKDLSQGVHIASGDIEAVQGAINGINVKDIEMKTNADKVTGELESVEAFDIHDKNFYVNFLNYNVLHQNLINIKSGLDAIQDKTITITTKVNTINSGDSKADGTAYASGNLTNKGKRSTDDSGVALGGEQGPELLVRDGGFYIVGKDSAGLFNYEKDDIIFNSDQTEQIFKYGRIRNGKKRGKTYADGTAFSRGTGTFYNGGAVTGQGSVTQTPSGSGGGESNETPEEKSALEKFQEWFSKLFDWIEVKLERQADKISKYVQKAERATENGSYNSAAKNYFGAIRESGTLAGYNAQGYSRYRSQADSVMQRAVSEGILSSEYASELMDKIHSGRIDINEYSSDVQEVIQSYSEWYNKAVECEQAIEDLNDQVQNYVKSLKELRNAQRDATLSSIDSSLGIGNGGVRSGSSTSAGSSSRQYRYANRLIKKKDKAYFDSVNNNLSDAVKLGRTANNSVSGELSSKEASNNEEYRKALDNAQKAIKASKPVSKNDLKIIKKYSQQTYSDLYAYNLGLQNYYDAREEASAEYAANNAEIYQNIADLYADKDAANENKRNLLQQKLGNAKSTKSKNSYLNKISKTYNTTLSNDIAEIEEYGRSVEKNRSKILQRKGANRAAGYNNLSDKNKQKVNDIMDKARECVKQRKAIPPDVLAKIADYYEKRYIGAAFYTACINYNNALESKKEAEAQFEIDRETAKAEKEAISAQKFQNVADKYSNKDESTEDKRSLLQQKADNAKSVKGKNKYLTKISSTYDTVIANDRAEISEYARTAKYKRKNILQANKNHRGDKYGSLSDKVKKKVNDAIDKAQSYVKQNKKIPESLMNDIYDYYSKGYIRDKFYTSCLDYNNALDSKKEAEAQFEIDRETAKAEKEAISAQKFQNVADKYADKDEATEDKRSLLQQKANNAKSASGKNKYLKKIADTYDTIITNDKAEIKEYSRTANSKRTSILQGNKTHQGDKFNSLSDKNKKKVNDVIDKAQSYAKQNKKIPESIMNKLFTYYSKGYISSKFYTSCLDYNNALDSKKEAEAQLAIDEETAKTEKAALGAEMVSNIEREYENKLNKKEAAKTRLETAQRLRTTRGLSMRSSDYKNLINNSKEQQKIYQQEAAAVLKQINENLENEYWTRDSQEYKDAMLAYQGYINSAEECKIAQEEWNNAIIALPFQKIEKIIDKLEAVEKYHKSLNELTKALGQDLLASDYKKEIADIQKEIDKYNELSNLARENYNIASASADNVYGGKTANEWQTEWLGYSTTVNELKIQIESIKDTLRDDVYWRSFERAHQSAERLKTVMEGIDGLLDDSSFIDKNGKLTKYGAAHISDLYDQYKLAKKEVKNYSNDLDNLEKLYKKGQYTELEYKEKLGEIQSSLLDAASGVKTLTDSIIDMYKSIAQAELDSLFEIIDARSEAINKKKEYYSFGKEVRSQQKEINSLMAQVEALNGVSDAASRAKRAELQAQLQEAQDELNDTINEHVVEISQDALNELRDTLQESFDDHWDHIGGDLSAIKELLKSANELSKTSADSNTRVLSSILKFYGIKDVSDVGIDAAMASGTMAAPRKLRALVGEKGNEIVTTQNGLILTLNKGDGVIPANLTKNLVAMASGVLPSTAVAIPKIDTSNKGMNITQHYDSLINIEGSADAATVEDLKRFSAELLEKSYNYTSQKIYSGYIKAGGKRVV